MLSRIKQIWRDFRVVIISAAVLAAYLIGKKIGKEDEKIRQNKAVLANVSRADSARGRLRDPRVSKRLQDKYGRK